MPLCFREDNQWFPSAVSASISVYSSYDEASELTSVDERVKGLGVSYYDCDVLGHVTKKTTGASVVYYAFDLSGQRNSFAEDVSGMLAKRLLSGGLPHQAMSNLFCDAAGRSERDRSPDPQRGWYRAPTFGVITFVKDEEV